MPSTSPMTAPTPIATPVLNAATPIGLSPHGLPPQAADELHILLGDVMPVDAGTLQHRRDALETGLAEEGTKALPPDLALADRRVAIPVGAQRVGGVVHVQQLELLEADLRVDLVDQVLRPLRRRDVVAGGEEMAGVDAEAKALGAARLVDQLGGLVEVASEELRRACGVLVHDRATFAPGERLLDQVDRTLARIGARVVLERSGMHHHSHGTDPIADPQGV